MTDPRVRFLAGVDDDALNAVLRLLDEPTIRITAGPLTEWRHQVLLFALVDLLGRVFPRLEVAVDSTPPASSLLPPGGVTIGDRLADIRRRSLLVPFTPGEPTIVVHVGAGGDTANVYVDAAEWQSYVGRRPSRLSMQRRDTAVGPLAAASRAGAEIYATLLAPVLPARDVPPEIYASALTYRVSSDPLDEPEPPELGPLDAFLIGAGSVGGAATYAFAYEPLLTGRLIICDPQLLEPRNTYRAILATAEATLTAAAKADEVKTALSHHTSLTVDAHVQSMAAWEADQDGPRPLPLVLVAVDNRDARDEIQDALPLDVVNAAVGANFVAVSGHRTGSGPCMCCLHMPDVLDARRIKNRLIAEATHLDQQRVNEMRVRSTPLDRELLRQIAVARGLVRDALALYDGKSLDDLYLAEILYGETEAHIDGEATVAVAAPFVTMLTGVLLAGEALKRTTPAGSAYVLGPDGIGVQYRENPYLAAHGYVDAHVARWEICLCRSVRRLRILADLYGLDVDGLIA